MERKLDSDIEEIRNILQDRVSEVAWNKAAVWSKIEQETQKKKRFAFWPIGLAASVAAISILLFWRFDHQETKAISDVTANSSIHLNVESNDVLVSEEVKPEMDLEAPLAFAENGMIKSQTKKRNDDGFKNAVNLSTLKPIVDLKMESFVEPEPRALASVAVVHTKFPNLEAVKPIEDDNTKSGMSGKKITLVIPEEDKMLVTSDVKVVRFIQKVGEYNRTGEWESEEKKTIGKLWAKFVESTKTETKTKL